MTTPEDALTEALNHAHAQLEEQTELTVYLGERAVRLNLERRAAERTIAALREEVADLRVDLARVNNELLSERARGEGAHAADAAQRAET